MKHKVGDIVRINLTESKYFGKEATITRCNGIYDYYDLDIDKGESCWYDTMFDDDFNPTRPIGSTFEYEGKTYKIIEGVCINFSFYPISCEKSLKNRGDCACWRRKDNKSVIFKQINKNDMETKVELRVKEGITKVIIPENCDFEVKDRTIVVTTNKAVRTWDDLIGEAISGSYINGNSGIYNIHEYPAKQIDKYVFASERHAKSALAMAQISQLFCYYGGEITDKEWADDNMSKYVIKRMDGKIDTACYSSFYFFLAFHTEQQRDDFLNYNEQLVKDYLMIE